MKIKDLKDYVHDKVCIYKENILAAREVARPPPASPSRRPSQR